MLSNLGANLCAREISKQVWTVYKEQSFSETEGDPECGRLVQVAISGIRRC